MGLGVGEQRVGRRRFLRSLGVSGVAAAAVQTVPGVAAAAVPTRTAYRFSTRGRHECSACRAHAANRFYRTTQAALADRAHKGCNCGLVPHALPVKVYFRYFAQGDVYDGRWARGKQTRGER